MTYIYALYDPRDPLIVRYVGKANDVEARLRGHVKAAKRSKKTYCLDWIRSLLKAGVSPQVKVIETVSKNWQVRERSWIKEYRRRNHPLTNGTDGGDGLSNPTLRTIKNLSDSHRAYFLSPAGVAARRRIGLRTRGIKLSYEHRRKMSESHKCRFSGLAGKQLRKRIGDKLRGRVKSPETIKNMRNAQLVSYAGPGGERRRLALSVAHSGKTVSLESRRKMSLAKLGVSLSVEHRQNIKAAGHRRAVTQRGTS